MGLADWFRDSFAPYPAIVDKDDPRAGVNQRHPRLSLVRTAPSREEWAAWRDDPTTLFILAALRNAAAAQKEAWDADSWHTGQANDRLLIELRTRADAYESIETADYEAFCEWAGVDPEPVEEA